MTRKKNTWTNPDDIGEIDDGMSVQGIDEVEEIRRTRKMANSAFNATGINDFDAVRLAVAQKTF